ncbi:hypothetical protein D2E36_16650 [Mycobacteroides abscessus]|nr:MULTISPECIES: hypothetical protein [Mycobacteroides]MBF9315820.1 hypothetical protein [Mycobacteroides chelonae]MDO3140317.1 hypothetical protein [Mycobacteroides abscessus subsp. abscessus]MDO3154223.1 hypothetical protein [Mycobacteroides abscessus subsp. abscessus]RIR33752.1 hypothetical protein D2E38_16040 [Mycobacteroides abscessus]RIR38971.1 hypothetical protein D2E36_16650 [Mycobacteroides abscessus]
MTSYSDIMEAASAPDLDDAVRKIKTLAAKTLSEADRGMRLLATDHFNHSYLPDFVMRWSNRPDRFVFLRASAYAEEIEDDVLRLADRHPIFVQLSEFVPLSGQPVRQAIDSLAQSAGQRKSLVASVPAIGLLDDPPRTGKMLSSFVMRGGRGLIEDGEAQTLAERVESGFDGAMHSDRAKTADAIDAVEAVLDPGATTEFTHLFEAAWISGGARAVDFPGGVTSIGDDLSADLLGQLLDIVPESLSDFWEQIGNAITLESFSGLRLLGDQPRLQSIMKNAVSRLMSNRCSMRRTHRSDQDADPFTWQVDDGNLSLRGGGYQAWVGTSHVPTGTTKNDDAYALDELPSLSKLSTRSENARLTISEIGVSDASGIAVRFTSPGDGDVATSDLVERVTASVGTLVRVNDVVARVNGKAVPVDYERGAASARTNSRVSVSGLIWNGWNLLAETDEEVRGDLERVLGLGSDSQVEDPPEENSDAATGPTSLESPQRSANAEPSGDEDT